MSFHFNALVDFTFKLVTYKPFENFPVFLTLQKYSKRYDSVRMICPAE